MHASKQLNRSQRSRDANIDRLELSESLRESGFFGRGSNSHRESVISEECQLVQQQLGEGETHGRDLQYQGIRQLGVARRL
jgi:hypothetical protein